MILSLCIWSFGLSGFDLFWSRAYLRSISCTVSCEYYTGRISLRLRDSVPSSLFDITRLNSALAYLETLRTPYWMFSTRNWFVTMHGEWYLDTDEVVDRWFIKVQQILLTTWPYNKASSMKYWWLTTWVKMKGFRTNAHGSEFMGTRTLPLISSRSHSTSDNDQVKEYFVFLPISRSLVLCKLRYW